MGQSSLSTLARQSDCILSIQQTKHKLIHKNESIKLDFFAVKYAEHLECFISCSTGAHNSVVVGYVEKASSVMRTTSFKYFHGVHCFDYHQKMNLIG